MAVTAPDQTEIIRMVQLYVDGMREGAGSKLQQAFHPRRGCLEASAAGALTCRLPR